jgi:hypothetical protein
MPEEHATELKIAIAELRTDLRHLSHDVKNALMKQEAFVPRRDMESKNDDIEARLASLESNQTWAARAIIGAWIAGAGVIAFGKRLFS